MSQPTSQNQPPKSRRSFGRRSAESKSQGDQVPKGLSSPDVGTGRSHVDRLLGEVSNLKIGELPSFLEGLLKDPLIRGSLQGALRETFVSENPTEAGSSRAPAREPRFVLPVTFGDPSTSGRVPSVAVVAEPGSSSGPPGGPNLDPDSDDEPRKETSGGPQKASGATIRTHFRKARKAVKDSEGASPQVVEAAKRRLKDLCDKYGREDPLLEGGDPAEQPPPEASQSVP